MQMQGNIHLQDEMHHGTPRVDCRPSKSLQLFLQFHNALINGVLDYRQLLANSIDEVVGQLGR